LRLEQRTKLSDCVIRHGDHRSHEIIARLDQVNGDGAPSRRWGLRSAALPTA
jgi:hypothetical protein